MSRRAACLACLACLALARLAPATAYSSLAGSCDHAGVVHGMDQIAPQPGTGGYTLKIGHPGVNVPGATVPVALSGDEAHKGFLVYAVLEDDAPSSAGRVEKEITVGSWDDAAMPDGAQTHPQCAHAATHDAFHNAGIVTDLLPFVVPEDLRKGARVTFKVTVVRDYETWFAFDAGLVVGAPEGAGDPVETTTTKFEEPTPVPTPAPTFKATKPPTTTTTTKTKPPPGDFEPVEDIKCKMHKKVGSFLVCSWTHPSVGDVGKFMVEFSTSEDPTWIRVDEERKYHDELDGRFYQIVDAPCRVKAIVRVTALSDDGTIASEPAAA